jgi:hypothetical protein
MPCVGNDILLFMSTAEIMEENIVAYVKVSHRPSLKRGRTPVRIAGSKAQRRETLSRKQKPSWAHESSKHYLRYHRRGGSLES